MNSLPFVRCVGLGIDIYQKKYKKAYDSRMICILAGDGKIEIEKSAYITKAGDVFVISPGSEYCVRSGTNQEIAVINFDTSYEYSHIKKPVLSVDSEAFCPDKILSCVMSGPLKERIYTVAAGDFGLFDELYRTYLRDDIEGGIKEFVLSSELAYIMAKIISARKRTNDLATEIYKYIIDNVCEKLTAENVAKHFNYSPSYIEKTLRKNYNVSFRQLIIETRLKKSLWLLENTSMSCSEISSELGFYSAQHFALMFRKKYNMKPTDLR